jgi:hypothetical protein
LAISLLLTSDNITSACQVRQHDTICKPCSHIRPENRFPIWGRRRGVTRPRRGLRRPGSTWIYRRRRLRDLAAILVIVGVALLRLGCATAEPGCGGTSTQDQRSRSACVAYLQSSDRNPFWRPHLRSAKAAELLMLKCSAWTCRDTRGLVNELIAQSFLLVQALAYGT